jgi:glucose-1-phosphate thymidylyltransferase
MRAVTSGRGEGGFLGLVPAGGRAARLAPLRYPKELLPVFYEQFDVDGDGPSVSARAIGEYALDAIALTGVTQSFVVVAPWKLDVLRYFADGQPFGMSIAYLYQEEARGLAHAVDLAHTWTSNSNVVFAMPDTMFHPSDALAQVRELFCDTQADLALALFPTPEPERFGPVLLDGTQVTAVLDKPAVAPVANTWGAAIWGPRFSALLHEGLCSDSVAVGEPVLGAYFDLAVQSGMRVHALYFVNGWFEDAGTGAGIVRCIDAARRAAVQA